MISVTVPNHQEASGSKGAPPSFPSVLAPSLEAGSLNNAFRGLEARGSQPMGVRWLLPLMGECKVEASRHVGLGL